MLTNSFNFVGRENEISQLETLVQQRVNIIGIYGIGGVGKSALAINFINYLNLTCLTLDLHESSLESQ